MLQPKPKKKIVKKKTNNPYEGQKDAFGNPVSGEGTRPPFTRKERSKMPRVGSMGSGKNGKIIKKAKSGGKFPDLNKDGKITKADILKGRGVIAQKGTKVKKQLSPAPKKKTGMDAVKALGKYVSTFGLATEGYNPAPSKKAKKTMKAGGSMKKCKYGCK